MARQRITLEVPTETPASSSIKLTLTEECDVMVELPVTLRRPRVALSELEDAVERLRRYSVEEPSRDA